MNTLDLTPCSGDAERDAFRNSGIVTDTLHSSIGGAGFIASAYDSGFPLSHDTYNGIYAASDGIIDHILCSESIDEGGKCIALKQRK